MLVACAHNDLLLELAAFAHEDDPFGTRWLPELRRGGVGLQVCPVYVDAADLPELALRRALEQVRAFLRAVREHAAEVLHVRNVSDLDAVERGERIGLVLALEGAEPLGRDADAIEIFWELGVRMVGLTWMRRNLFAEGDAEPAGGGLSRAGERLVDRLASLGGAIDLAHASDRTCSDVLDRCGKTAVLVSHAACRALVPSSRNVPDELLAGLGDRGGFVGIMCHPFALGAGSGLGDVCAHVEHGISVAGPACVGIGGDFTRQLARSGGVREPVGILLPRGQGLDDAVDGLAGPEDYPALAAALADRGHAGEATAAVMGGNLLRFLRMALPAATE